MYAYGWRPSRASSAARRSCRGRPRTRCRPSGRPAGAAGCATWSRGTARRRVQKAAILAGRVPELPDLEVYRHALARAHRRPRRSSASTLAHPFLLRTAVPPLDATPSASACVAIRRLGKRIVLALEGELFLVAPPDDRRAACAGSTPGAKPPAASRSPRSTSRTARSRSPRRARSGARRCTSCAARRRSRRSTRAASSRSHATSPSSPRASRARTTRSSARSPIRALLSGIGNAYSDEILHRARLSPLALRRSSTTSEIARLLRGDARACCVEWIAAPARPRPAARSPRRSPRSARRWPCTAATASPAPCAARRCSASSTPRTRPTTARAARPAASILADRALSRLLHKTVSAHPRRRVGAAPVVRNGEPHVRDELLATVDSTHEDQLQRILRRQRPQAVGFFLADPAAHQRGVALVDGGGPGTSGAHVERMAASTTTTNPHAHCVRCPL